MVENELKEFLEGKTIESVEYVEQKPIHGEPADVLNLSFEDGSKITIESMCQENDGLESWLSMVWRPKT